MKNPYILIILAAFVVLSACSAPDNTAADTQRKDPVPASSTAHETSAKDSVASSSGSQPQEKPDRSYEILAAMTVDEKIGQLFLAHYSAVTAQQNAVKYAFGGYILFAWDFEAVSKEQMSENLKAVQNAAKIKMLLGVDEEGGYINRVSSDPKYRSAPFASPQTLYANGGWDAIVQDSHEKTAFLKAIGINLNLSPVCDVSQNQVDYIHYRTLGKDAKTTATYAGLVAAAMRDDKMGSVLKHFPGYGDNRDTHDGMAYDNRDYDTFKNSDFLPFIEGIKAGAGCVLVSHNVVKCMDAGVPASLSPKVHTILREELGFNGVIMTDDLRMGAIRGYTGGESAAVKAILAGNDMLCCANAEQEFESVKAAVADGIITEKRLDESVLRILGWKLELGIIE